MPVGGGAATYYSLLSEQLIRGSIVQKITIVTEKYPGEPGEKFDMHGARRIVRLFPFRAGGDVGKLKKYFLYFLQNILYRNLPEFFKSNKIDIAIIHSSFHNQWNMLSPSIREIKKYSVLISDVRDCQLPERKLSDLEIYDKIIACSENVKKHLEKINNLMQKTIQIPIPQEDLKNLEIHKTETILESLGLDMSEYLLFAGLIKADKGVDLLLNSYEIYRNKVDKPHKLVLVGTTRDHALANKAARMKGVVLAGALPRQNLLTLIQNAAINVNVSFSEGMPRFCLESLAFNTRVILPQGIPEFEIYLHDWVAKSQDNPEVIADQIVLALENDPPAGYPIEEHYIDNIVHKYERLFQKLL